jgi:hypothetical protein
MIKYAVKHIPSNELVGIKQPMTVDPEQAMLLEKSEANELAVKYNRYNDETGNWTVVEVRITYEVLGGGLC